MSGKISSLKKIFCAPVRTGELDDPLSPWGMLAAEFPHVALAGGVPRHVPDLFITVEQWKSKIFNFYELDRRLDVLAESQGEPFALVLVGWGEELARTARQVLTRCQRWTDRRNEASRSPLFDRVLTKHREAHDLAEPPVRTEYNHALDTWHWVLRLAPEADPALQLAALLHDMERSASEALLREAGIDAEIRRRTTHLIGGHQRLPRGGHQDAAAVSLLDDADALSFFSLKSLRYLDDHGPEQTRKKVACTLGRLSPAARRYLPHLRLPCAVAVAIQEETHKLEETPQRVA